MNVLNQASGDNYTVFHGDCVDVLKGIPDASIDYSIFFMQDLLCHISPLTQLIWSIQYALMFFPIEYQSKYHT